MLMSSVAAFRPVVHKQKKIILPSSHLHPTTRTSLQQRGALHHSRRKHVSLLLSSQQTTPSQSFTTGWIRTDTLNFQETAAPQKNNNNNFTRSGTDTADNSNCYSIIYDEVGDTKIKYPSISPVECLLIRDRLVYIKRDDVLHLPLSNISGNKARKFLSLNSIPAVDFPDVLVTYGGPQSNAMVALAAIVSSKNTELTGKEQPIPNLDEIEDLLWQLDVLEEDVEEEEVSNKKNNHGRNRATNASSTLSSSPTVSLEDNTSAQPPKKRFIYYTKTLPRYLRKNPNGNLLRAISLGMEIRTVSHEEYNSLFKGLHGGSVMAPADLDPPVEGKSLWIPQGGACSIAQPGSNVLAKEIVNYWAKNGKGMPLAVCVPGGTCTTALLLHQSINRILEHRRVDNKTDLPDIRTVVIPCVGDDDYAMRQMMSLDKSMGGKGRREDMPFILKPRADVEYGSARRRRSGYFSFGEPSKAIIDAWDEMNECGLFLDLLYGAPAFSLLLQHWKSRDLNCPIAGRQVLYVHSGGLEGVASQLTRYKHKGLIDARVVQG